MKMQHTYFLQGFHAQALSDLDPDFIDADQTAGTDVYRFPIPERCFLHSVVMIVTEVFAGSSASAQVKFDLRPVVGSDADRGDGDVAEFDLGTTALGTPVYDETNKGLELSPGQEIVVEIAQEPAGTPSGHFFPMVKVTPSAEAYSSDSTFVEATEIT